MNSNNFSKVFINKIGILNNLNNICISYFNNKTDIVYCKQEQVDLTVCSSSQYLLHNYDVALIIFDNTEADSQINSKYFFNPQKKYTEAFFKFWLDRSFKELGIPYLTANPYRTILLIS